MKQLTSLTTSVLLLGATASAQISFNSAGALATGQRPDSAAFGDFDGDGDQDLAVTSGPQGGNLDAVEIWSNDGAGNFTQSAVILTGSNSGPSGLVATDLTGDGRPEIVVALHNQSSVLTLVNDGFGVFTPGGSVATGSDPRHLAAGDVDGDGDTDVVSSNRDGNSVTVLRNTGGALAAAGTTSVGADLRGVVVADFDGNGLGDVAVSSHDSRQVAVLLSSGGGALGAPTLLSVGANRRPEGLTAGDFDGNGTIDLCAATSLNNDSWATVFTNLGGSFGGAQHFAFLGSDPDGIVSADFDFDGDLDLAAANQDSNSVSALENSGAGTFGSPTTIAVGTTPEALVAGDFDGDGDADLAVVNRDSNNVSLLENPGGGAGWTSYCVSSANSIGSGALIGASGSVSFTANSFTIDVTGAPSSVGLFFYGSQQAQTPAGNGSLCVAGSTFRLNPATAADGAGFNSRLLDFTTGNPSTGGGTISPDSTWYFQYWYRDVAAGGAQFNFSDGLQVNFTL